jgi:hypothetical protein
MNKRLEFGERELVFEEAGKKELTSYTHNGRVSFVPTRLHQQLPIAGAPPSEQNNPRTTGYDPTVSAAPLALYLGSPSP